MAKVRFLDRRVCDKSKRIWSIIFTTITGVLIFVDIPVGWRLRAGIAALALLVAVYVRVWYKWNNLTHLRLHIEGSQVHVKAGDIFRQPGLRVIAFNEYFDTLVDDRIISKQSLNGVFIKEYLDVNVATFDEQISKYPFDEANVISRSVERAPGKRIQYKIGTIYPYKDYLITAFAKFDRNNKATLTMPEYLEFLITFWDNVNAVYSQRDVSTPIFGSGITRIDGHKDISDEDLLKIMLWTFRISEMRFKYPAKLSIVIDPQKISQINLLDIESIKYGL